MNFWIYNSRRWGWRRWGKFRT